MKKKTAALLLCMAIAVTAGCAGGENRTEGTEAVATETGTEVTSGDIEYNVDDYVTLGDYMDVEVSLNAADYVVDEDAVNAYADKMIAYYQPYLPDSSRTVVEKGDVVDVDYVGKKDGEAFEGGSAEGALINTENNTNAAMGTGYIDGFSDGLPGAKVGDTIDCEVTFPEDYQSEELKGQTVTFTFTINSIDYAVTRDNIDDAYVSENFKEDSVEDFYNNIRTYLEQQAETAKETDIRTAVIDAVTDKCTVENFPEGLLEARVEEYIAGFEKQYCTNGTSLSDYLMTNYSTTEEDFRAQTKEYMEENLKQELVFEAIVKAENIEFVQEEFDTYITNLVSNGGFASEEALYETYGPDQETGKKYLQKIYLENKACQKIAESTKVNYEEAKEEVRNTETVAESTEE